MTSSDEWGREPSAVLADHLRGQIAAGQLRPGDEVPDAETLAESHGIAPEVAAVALAELRREGWMEGPRVRRRPDPVVRDSTRPDPEVTAVVRRLAAQGSPIETVVESVRTALPTAEQVAELGVPVGLPVLAIRREYWSDGVLVEWSEQALPGESTELRYALPSESE